MESNKLDNLYKEREKAREVFDAADAAFIEEIRIFVDGLHGTEKNLVRDLEEIKQCSEIDPGFKDWLDSKFYKYEGGIVDADDVSVLGNSILIAYGVDSEIFDYSAVIRRINNRETSPVRNKP